MMASFNPHKRKGGGDEDSRKTTLQLYNRIAHRQFSATLQLYNSIAHRQFSATLQLYNRIDHRHGTF
jgi:hypothetical protein